MPIEQSVLRAAAGRQTRASQRTLAEARVVGARTAFLSHSHKDKTLAQGLVELLALGGCAVYVDWSDAEMPPNTTRETARRIKQKISDLDLFLFLATSNSLASRWCPWELGYADGVKPIDSIVMVPTLEGGSLQGSEYLGLYRWIDDRLVGQLEIRGPGLTSTASSIRGL